MRLDWGVLRWLLTPRVNIFSVLFFGCFQGACEEVHNQTLHLLGYDNYYRCAPRIEYLKLVKSLILGRGNGLAEELDAIAEGFTRSPKFAELVTKWLKDNGWGAHASSVAREASRDQMQLQAA
jgi:hypothetical protein